MGYGNHGQPGGRGEECGRVMLEAVDGRAHLALFREIAPHCRLVFIDKPFAITSQDAVAIVKLAQKHQVTIMSSSSLRYAQGLQDELARAGEEGIIGVDCAGPLHLQPTQPGFFWYGIHAARCSIACWVKVVHKCTWRQRSSMKY
ncbi:hypothetical protein [Paenibacillus sp. JCM 10914]|uniref:hypothetical protein n=1 Tax=Paenibacillus sp. JCM 10914 TaxID=1236974 RepID=UPI00269B29BD